MVSRGLFGNLGDPGRSPVMGVVADKPKRGGSHDDALEVGPTHIRGVVRVMSGASTGLTRRVGSYTQSEGETPTMHRNGDWVQTKLKLIRAGRRGIGGGGLARWHTYWMRDSLRNASWS